MEQARFAIACAAMGGVSEVEEPRACSSHLVARRVRLSTIQGCQFSLLVSVSHRGVQVSRPLLDCAVECRVWYNQ